MNTYNIDIISFKEAINEILNTNKFEYLQSCLETEGEIEYDNNKWVISYKNGKNLNNNLYTNYNSKKYKWISVKDNLGNIIALQFIYIDNDYIELINVNKVDGYKDIFENIVNFISNTYNKDIITFPLNNKLTSYYKKFGFMEYKNDYLKYIIKQIH